MFHGACIQCKPKHFFNKYGDFKYVAKKLRQKFKKMIFRGHVISVRQKKEKHYDTSSSN